MTKLLLNKGSLGCILVLLLGMGFTQSLVEEDKTYEIKYTYGSSIKLHLNNGDTHQGYIEYKSYEALLVELEERKELAKDYDTLILTKIFQINFNSISCMVSYE